MLLRNGANRLPLKDTLRVFYVAEFQQNLNSVQVLVRISPEVTGGHVEFIVQPTEDGSLTGSDSFVIQCGQLRSPVFSLPVPVVSGPQEVQAIGEHYEVKLIVPPLAPTTPSPTDATVLLDAAQLTSLRPSTFNCASCSLPVVQSSKIETYKDLPSEHWEELMDAWMCHADQKLSDSLAKQANGGFWPTPGRVFVGGSYLLFDESNVVAGTLSSTSSCRVSNLLHPWLLRHWSLDRKKAVAPFQ